MRLPVFSIFLFSAVSPAMAHAGAHAHPHGIVAGVAAVLAAALAVVTARTQFMRRRAYAKAKGQS